MYCLSIPKWRHSHCFSRRAIPAAIKSWLFESNSITERLLKIAGNSFTIRIIFQGWQQPRLDDLNVLNVKPREIVMVRETELLVNDQVWICARSVFPQSALKDRGQKLLQLKNQPLGKVLYADPTLKRTKFEIATLKFKQKDDQQKLWARRSRYKFYGNDILVSEIFLPALLDF